MLLKYILVFYSILFLSAFAKNEKIILLTEELEPFITEKSENLSGPFIEAFTRIAQQHDIDFEFQKVPIRRALKDVEKFANNCVFAANYSPETSETLLYVSRLSEMKIWAYSLQNRNIAFKSLQSLKNNRVGAIDISEVRDLLSLNGIQYTPIFRNSSAIKMLLSQRFDVLIGDINLEFIEKTDSKKIKPHLQVLTVEKWLICNQNLNKQTLRKLKSALSEGLFPTSTKKIWEKYNMGKFYQANRRN